MSDGLDYLREAIILRAKEDYMRSKADGRAIEVLEREIRSDWWGEVILEHIDPEAVIDAWRKEKAALRPGQLWRAPKEYNKTLNDD